MNRPSNRTKPRARLGALCCVIAACTVACGWQSGISDAEIRRAAPEEWVTPGRDYAETHYSPLDQINTTNANRLGLAWSLNLEIIPASDVRATPLFHDGVIYGSLSNGTLFAVDARAGKLKWRWDPEIPLEAFQTDAEGNRVLDENGQPIRIGPSVCCGGRFNRGVAIYHNKVYAGLLDGSLVALNAETGKVAWQTQTADFHEDYSITQAPRIVKGNVIIGNSGAEYGVRGYVSAYDAETGDMVWRFYTVPGDPSKGFENAAMEMAAKTWTGEWWEMGGGGTVWDSLAYDPDLDLLYVGTGNGGPWPQSLRSPGGGDNLFLSSIVALRPDTGEYVWHYQTTPGDNWDYTATQTMILADLEIDGRMRQVLMQAPKNGFFYILDRRTGEFLSGEPFVNVTWATGIDPSTGRPMVNPDAVWDVHHCALVSPAPSGAHNWDPMSYNPGTNLAYLPSRDGGATFVQDPGFEFQRGRFNIGNGLLGPGKFSPTRGQRAQCIGELSPVQASVQAWDPIEQKERWRVPGFPSGTLTTAGNLVFFGIEDPASFGGYNAETGEMAWHSDAIAFGAPMTYMLEGKQYVLTMGARPDYWAERSSRRSNPPPFLLAFTLDGDAALPAAAQPAPEDKAGAER